jgi:hypothetical protein
MSSESKKCIKCGNFFPAERRNAKCVSCRDLTPCSICKCGIPKNQNRKTCKKCSAEKNVDSSKPKEKTCPAIIGGKIGDRVCGKNTRKEFDFEYCGFHKQEYRQQQDIRAGKIGKYCTAHSSCSGENGYKAFLELDDEHDHCEGCRALRQNYENGVIAECISFNKKSKNGERKCYECGKNILHDVGMMGKDSHCNVSNLCKKHFKARQNFEGTRDRDLTKKYIQQKGHEAEKDQSDDIHKLYKICATEASSCGWDFNMDIKLFKIVIQKPCYYCHCLDNNQSTRISRIDNKIEYNAKNVIPCCKTCNTMKNELVHNIFVLSCARITFYKSTQNAKMYVGILNDSDDVPYTEYMRSVKKKNIDFVLSVHQFNYFISKKCNMCGRKSSEYHFNDISRLDNGVGYEFDNCETCCSVCKSIQASFDTDEVLEKCDKITNLFNTKLDKMYNNWMMLNKRAKKDALKNIDESD